jgi:nucleotide-binding universal stress UspA family protein
MPGSRSSRSPARATAQQPGRRRLFETIVVGVDGGEGGRDALALAARMRRTFGSRLIAVLAYPHDSFISRASSPPYEAIMRDEAHRTLARELERAAVDAEPEVASDSSPRRALHGAADRHDAELIVVGANRHGPIVRMLAGDVTVETVHGAPCAVAVAPRGPTETAPALRTVGVGFDGSAESRAALDLGLDVARAAGARLQLLWVVPAAIAVDPWASAVERTEGDRAARKQAEALVAETVGELGDDAIGDTAPGLAHEELAQLSREVDLLVVGSRGHGPLRRLLLGSTSTRLVRKAACPVLVLPRDAKRHAAAAAAGATVVQKAA